MKMVILLGKNVLSSYSKNYVNMSSRPIVSPVLISNNCFLMMQTLVIINIAAKNRPIPPPIKMYLISERKTTS